MLNNFIEVSLIFLAFRNEKLLVSNFCNHVFLTFPYEFEVLSGKPLYFSWTEELVAVQSSLTEREESISFIREHRKRKKNTILDKRRKKK